MRAIAKNLTSFGRRSFSTSPLLPGLSQEQISKIEKADNGLRSRHMIIEGTLTDSEKDIARRKRMIYRSKQRGWLEADILMGSWASEFVPNLSAKDLDDYEVVLKEETIDIFNYITGKDALPERLQGLPVMKQLQSYALHSKLYEPQDYENIKRKSNLT
jgi:succinate dehydrogenase assembly factor 2